ncbi:hypothetical protein E3N88_32044 [Mikania micrantha]|uniref:Uncharacterized protein n=1 Tax=Mikania micrantha TaxID=192012 RepID=A0A5N6M7B5_9ASTR|nr:hypothetical protein E3N88_32044 [Mikania micrantha]
MEQSHSGFLHSGDQFLSCRLTCTKSQQQKGSRAKSLFPVSLFWNGPQCFLVKIPGNGTVGGGGDGTAGCVVVVVPCSFYNRCGVEGEGAGGEEAASEQVKSPSTNHSSGECIDEEISCKGAAVAQLLEQSDHAINQVSANANVFKENGMQMNDNSNSSRKHTDKKTLGKAAYQQVKPSSTNDSNGLHYADSDEDMDDDISYKAIGGAAARLLEQNDQAINQILANVSANKLHENIVLESQTRNNLNILLNESLYDMPEMKPSARQLYDLDFLKSWPKFIPL